MERDWQQHSDLAARHLANCHLCPHHCGARRLSAQGFCRVGQDAYIASEMLHMGEEEILRPAHAIFFSGCTATCSFCTAARFAFRPTYGIVVSPQQLAQRILQRQDQGARSVAFIGGDPTPHLPFIVAVRAALGNRLHIPLVFNSNYYLTTEALALMEGVVDIHLPDLKFGPSSPGRDCGLDIGGMPNYWQIVPPVLESLLAQGKRIIVRHLLMPGHIECCTEPVLRWLGNHLGAEVSLLTQYLAPAHAHGVLAQSVSEEDIARAQALARNLQLRLVS